MFRVIREIQPPWIIGENVPGIIRMALEDICIALESEDYEVQPFIIPSASIGSWDKRDRVWIIAYNQKSGIGRLPVQQRGQNKTGDLNSDGEIKSDSNSNGFNSDNAGYNSGSISQKQKAEVQLNSDVDCKSMEGHSGNELTERQADQIRRDGQANWLRNWIEVASELCRSNARVPNRMDRIKSLGNSVNPYVPYEIFKIIEQFNKSH